MTKSNFKAFQSTSTLRMVYTALMTALVFVSTFSIKLSLPFTGGYIHPGDSMVFLSGLLLGPFYGAFAAGVGSALSDLLGGYTFWVIPTLIIKASMGFIVGLLANKAKSKLRHSIAIIFSLIWVAFTGITVLVISQAHEKTALFDLALRGLMEESESPMEVVELTNLMAKTSTYLLIILIGVPLLLGILYILSKQFKKSTLPVYISVSYILAGTLMVIGYFLTYGLLTNNFMVPIFSVPGNMLQFIGGFIIASFLTPILLFIKKNSRI